jgi:esterase/lipase superfamily enzyme
MVENYHKWFSQYINREFEMLVFGTGGIPVVLFPPAGERYYAAKDKGLISSLQPMIEEGKIKVYCLDSHDNKSWYNFSIEPSERVSNYRNFENLIIHDIIGFTRYETHYNKAILAGIDFGGYHALNFGLKHPDMASGIISIGGFFDIKRFIYGFYDDNCYFNNPPDYLPGLTEESFIESYKKMNIYFISEEKHNHLPENENISSLLTSKGVNNQLKVVKPTGLWEIGRNNLGSVLTDIVADYREKPLFI